MSLYLEISNRVYSCNSLIYFVCQNYMIESERKSNKFRIYIGKYGDI